MYLRIMNQLDAAFMGEAIYSEIKNPIVSGAVMERVSYSIAILDNSYGENRKAFDMGGYVFLLTNPHDSEKIKSQILGCYGLSEENSEYSEEICKGSNKNSQLLLTVFENQNLSQPANIKDSTLCMKSQVTDTPATFSPPANKPTLFWQYTKTRSRSHFLTENESENGHQKSG